MQVEFYLVLLIAAQATRETMSYYVIGCYNDSAQQRDMIISTDINDNSYEKCIHLCSNSGGRFAGLSGNKCNCDNKFGSLGVSTGCTTPCPGNSSQLCGGTLANTILASESSYTPYWPLMIIGCYGDSAQHELMGASTTFAGNTYETCRNYCEIQGFKYAGTQSGTQCFCGNSFGSLGLSNACTTPCPGYTPSMCGGTLANTIIPTTLLYGCSEYNPCQHGGVCHRPNAYEYTCTCPFPYGGEYCEIELVSFCDSNPCQNGGQCVRQNGQDDTCNCPLPFTGTFCETAVGCNCNALHMPVNGQNNQDMSFCQEAPLTYNVWYFGCLDCCTYYATGVTDYDAEWRHMMNILYSLVIVGCYADNQTAPEMTSVGQITNIPSDWSIYDVCYESCYNAGPYTYMAIQNGNTCVCGNSYGLYGKSSTCTIPCPGDPYMICGGPSANTIINYLS